MTFETDTQITDRKFRGWKILWLIGELRKWWKLAPLKFSRYTVVLIYTHRIETLLGHFIVSLPEVLRTGQHAIPRKWLCRVSCTRGMQELLSSPSDCLCQLMIDRHVCWWLKGYTFKLKDNKFAAGIALASIVCKSGPFWFGKGVVFQLESTFRSPTDMPIDPELGKAISRRQRHCLHTVPRVKTVDCSCTLYLLVIPYYLFLIFKCRNFCE